MIGTGLESSADAILAYQDALQEKFADTFRDEERLRMSEWAARHRMLSGGAEPGPWRNERTPYLVEIMDAVSDPTVREVVVMKSARVGYTDGVVGNTIGYFMHQDPTSILVVQPTGEDAKDWSKKSLDPLIQETPVLRELGHWNDPVKGQRTKLDNTLNKFFTGGSLTIRGAHSPSQLRRHTTRVVLFDEVDGFKRTREGDSLKLGERAARTFINRKIVKGSTPTTAAESKILREYRKSDQRRYYVPCPHCDHRQVLRFGDQESVGGLKWEQEVHCKTCGTEYTGDGEEPCRECSDYNLDVKHLTATTHYQCESCAQPIHEYQKTEMVQAGEWRAENPGALACGFHISSLYTLLGTWEDIVVAFLEATDPETMQVWVNQYLGEVWEEKNRDVDTDDLNARQVSWGMLGQERVEVPHGIGVLTASVDVQGDRLELAVVGWGQGHESWLVTHVRIYGDPEGIDVWDELDHLMSKTWLHASGRRVRIRSCMIDAGYLPTTVVYPFVKGRQLRGIYASNGVKRARQVLVRASRKNRQGVKPWTISTFHYKQTLFRRLKVGRPGAVGYMNFCQPTLTGADAEFFAQFAGEMAVRKLVGGQIEVEYKQVRNRNEAIDLYVMAMAALDALGDGVKKRLAAMARTWSTPPGSEPVEGDSEGEAEDVESGPTEEGTEAPSRSVNPAWPMRPRGRRGGWAGGWR